MLRAAAIFSLAAVSLFSREVAGDWTLRALGDSGQVEIELRRSGMLAARTQYVRVAVEDLDGYRSGDVRFHLIRPAGTFSFARTAESADSGTFTFAPDASFRRKLAAVARDSWDDERLYQMAVRNVSVSFLERLASTGTRSQWSFDLMRRYELAGTPAVLNLTEDNAELLRSRGVSPERVRQLRESGYLLSAEEMIQLQAHGVSADFLRQMKLSGQDQLSVTDMIRLRTHGIDDLDVQRMKAQGMDRPTVDDMVRWKTNGSP